MSKILITGGAGFIGSNLAEELVDQGHDVKILDNFNSGKEANISSIRADIELVKGDVRNLETVRSCLKDVEYVFHLAALVSVSESVKNPPETNAVNVNGTLNILSTSKELGVKRLIYASSCAVYGNIEQLPIKEDTKQSPESPYALTKLVSEEYCKLFYKQYGLETVSLRYFNAYGPMQNPESLYAAVIPKFITTIMSDGQPIIYGDGNQTRDFIFVKDVVRANILAMEAKSISGQVFNIGSGKAKNINSLLDVINRILAKQTKPEHAPPRPGDIRHSLADISKAREQLGYSPKYSFSDGLQETIQWFKEQHKSKEGAK